MSEIYYNDAARFGFSPEASGIVNTRALQQALDAGGTVAVLRPGTYDLAGTVLIGSNTTLLCGNGVVFRKAAENGEFCHVILNRGALSKTWDEHIVIRGLRIDVNGVDSRKYMVYGLHGQLAFHYVRDLCIEDFRCLNIGKAQYGVHICTFEDVLINNAILKGDKDGIHFGRGKRFRVSNCVFETYDDAVALNAHDYDIGNPELGWIEDGVVENCHDLDEDGDRPRIGFFSRIIAGAWLDWHKGITVQKSDTVVSSGRLYRVCAEPDGTQYVSVTQPTHESGSVVLDGITWLMVQNDVTYTAGVRNVTFRNIFLHKPRIAFAVHFDNDRWSRSYYPGAVSPTQEQLFFDNIRVLYDQHTPLFAVATPVDLLSVSNSCIRDNSIYFITNKAMKDYFKTRILLNGCVFGKPGEMDLVVNEIEGKQLSLTAVNSTVMHDDFTAGIRGDRSRFELNCDLPGLR